MCLCVQPYRHNTRHLPDEQAPAETAKNEKPEPSPEVPDIMMDNRGLTYMAVRNCDLERFSVK
jgi:hypothetical protein